MAETIEGGTADIAGHQILNRVRKWPNNISSKDCKGFQYEEVLLLYDKSEDETTQLLAVIFSNSLLLVTLKEKSSASTFKKLRSSKKAAAPPPTFESGKLIFFKYFPLTELIIDESPMSVPGNTDLPYPFLLLANSGEKMILSSKKDRRSFSDQLFHHICKAQLDLDPSYLDEVAWSHSFRRGTIHYAVMKDDVDLMNILLGFPSSDGGSHLEVMDADGRTPVDLIINFESMDCLNNLLEKGKIDKNETDSRQWTLIHRAAAMQKVAVIVSLVTAGAEIDCFSLNGYSPLHIAVRMGLENSVVCLLQSGANPNLRTEDAEECPPINMCEDDNILRWLVAYGARIDRKRTLQKNWTDNDISAHVIHWDYVNQSIEEERTKVQNRVVSKSDKDWMADKDYSECTLCSTEFTATNRRHHCRACGRLCCNKCSSRKLWFLAGGKKDKQRACDVCVNKSFASSGKLVRTKTDHGELNLTPTKAMKYKVTGELHDAKKRMIQQRRQQHELLDKLNRNVEKAKEIEEKSQKVLSKADVFEDMCKKISCVPHRDYL